MLPSPIHDQVQAIAADHSSGATDLTLRAADAFAALTWSKDLRQPFASAVRELAAALIDAQPSMAPIFNLANAILLAMDQVDDAFAQRERVHEVCQESLTGLRQAGPIIAKYAQELIPPKGVVMTHSHSSSVRETLLAAHATGQIFSVICTESRPVGEGVYLAQRLAQAGIDVRLVIDAAMYHYLPGVQVIMVGADQLAPNGLVNKMGTALLAVAAQTWQTPIYSLCSTQKFLPRPAGDRTQKLQPGAEIVDREITGVRIENFYFDSTPLERLTGIVCEEGILDPAAARQRLLGQTIHPYLAD
ncbi:MAG: hypothetical protein GYB66_11055 [Chloroflexi bacterium]|nr:hypothetical protein [Chloroflexota bacterium]